LDEMAGRRAVRCAMRWGQPTNIAHRTGGDRPYRAPHDLSTIYQEKG
jgi:hypothetical protein